MASRGLLHHGAFSGNVTLAAGRVQLCNGTDAPSGGVSFSLPVPGPPCADRSGPAWTCSDSSLPSFEAWMNLSMVYGTTRWNPTFPPDGHPTLIPLPMMTRGRRMVVTLSYFTRIYLTGSRQESARHDARMTQHASRILIARRSHYRQPTGSECDSTRRPCPMLFKSCSIKRPCGVRLLISRLLRARSRLRCVWRCGMACST